MKEFEMRIKAPLEKMGSVTDALSQVKTYAYAKDGRLTGVTYTGAVNPTPNVSFTYNPYFPRLTAMTDGTGTRQYMLSDVLAIASGEAIRG